MEPDKVLRNDESSGVGERSGGDFPDVGMLDGEACKGGLVLLRKRGDEMAAVGGEGNVAGALPLRLNKGLWPATILPMVQICCVVCSVRRGRGSGSEIMPVEMGEAEVVGGSIDPERERMYALSARGTGSPSLMKERKRDFLRRGS